MCKLVEQSLWLVTTVVFNPDFAVEIVVRGLKAIQKRLSGYFLATEILKYFKVEKCPQSLLCEAFKLRN
jgi:hypothetical protein